MGASALSDWIRFLADARALQGIYGADIPSLHDVDLHEVSLHRDGPRATLRFDLATFPASPSAKWIAAGCNRVQLQLTAIVREVSISGWQARCRIDLSIGRDGDALDLRADNGTVKIALRASALMLDKVSAYRDEG